MIVERPRVSGEWRDLREAADAAEMQRFEVHTYDSPTQVAYCSTKGAISMLGKALRAVPGKHAICVNVVEPGAGATNTSAGPAMRLM